MALRRASRSDLGLDPTMTWLGDSDGNYDIVIADRKTGKDVVYRTEKVLANYVADSPISRGSRVYLARQLQADGTLGELVALKDTWIDTTRTPEGVILRSIRASIVDQDELKEFDRLFLSVVHEGPVRFLDASNDLRADDHEMILRRQPFPFDARRFDLMQDPPVNPRANPARGYPFVPPTDNTELVSRGPMSHYRIVYKEIGNALFMCNDVGQYCSALLDICRGQCLLLQLDGLGSQCRADVVAYP